MDDGTREAIVRAAHALERAGLTARFELPEKLHVTLAFLGAVDSDRIGPLADALREKVAAIPPFSVRFDRLGAFPNSPRARIAWVGANKADPAFVRLAEAVRAAARAFATLDEKPAVLHVTLARLREPMQLPRVPFTACTMRVDAIVLFESLPQGQTSRYEVVERFPLTVHASSPAASK